MTTIPISGGLRVRQIGLIPVYYGRVSHVYERRMSGLSVKKIVVTTL